MEKMYLFESKFYDKNDRAFEGADGTYISRNLQKLMDYGQKCHESKLKEFEVHNIPHTSKINEFKGSRKIAWIIDDGNYTFINSIREVDIK